MMRHYRSFSPLLTLLALAGVLACGSSAGPATSRPSDGSPTPVDAAPEPNKDAAPQGAPDSGRAGSADGSAKQDTAPRPDGATDLSTAPDASGAKDAGASKDGASIMDASAPNDAAGSTGKDAAADSGTLKDATDTASPSLDAAVDTTTPAGTCPSAPSAAPSGIAAWDSLIGFKSAASFYSSASGIYVAENVLYYQNDDGGWPKNIDMSTRTAAKDAESMIDNNATTTQLQYLAYMVGAFPGCGRYRDAFSKGMAWLFAAQYASNGGWPQSYPKPHAEYAKHITYNDNAMVHVLTLLREIVYGNSLYSFLSADTKTKATGALAKGIDCVLKTQIVAAGKKTGWCAQHDENTLAPANARAYELASESGSEGPGVLAFLMTLDLDRTDMPKDQIVAAVEGAAVFYDSVKIPGYKWVKQATSAGPEDNVLVADANSTVWARFYELGTFKPFFCDRDGVKKYDVTQIGYERRSGYAWYGTWPAAILKTTYPAWASKWTPGRNVLK